MSVGLLICSLQGSSVWHSNWSAKDTDPTCASQMSTQNPWTFGKTQDGGKGQRRPYHHHMTMLKQWRSSARSCQCVLSSARAASPGKDQKIKGEFLNVHFPMHQQLTKEMYQNNVPNCWTKSVYTNISCHDCAKQIGVIQK